MSSRALARPSRATSPSAPGEISVPAPRAAALLAVLCGRPRRAAAAGDCAPSTPAPGLGFSDSGAPRGRILGPPRLRRPRQMGPAERNLRIPRRAQAPLSRRYSDMGRPCHGRVHGTSAVTKHSYCTRYPPHTLLFITRTTKITHVDDPVDNVLRRTTRLWRRGGRVVEKTCSPQAGE